MTYVPMFARRASYAEEQGVSPPGIPTQHDQPVQPIEPVGYPHSDTVWRFISSTPDRFTIYELRPYFGVQPSDSSSQRARKLSKSLNNLRRAGYILADGDRRYRVYYRNPIFCGD